MSPQGSERRLFVALWPDAELAAATVQAASLVRSGCRPVPASKLHLTLAFVGRLPEARVGDCVAALGRVRHAGFDLSLDRFGHWARHGVLWLGPEVTPPECAALAGAIGEVLSRAGIPVDRRRFRAHLTVARKCRKPKLPRLAVALRWRVNAFRLVESKLAADGSEYICLQEWALD